MKTKRMTLRAVGLLLTAIMVISAIPATALTASADAPSVELSDPEVVIEIHVTPEPDEEPVESPGFDVKVDNWGGSGTEEDPFTIHNRVGLENLAMISERGYSFSGIYFALTGDFSIETPVIGAQYSFIGSEDVPFAGVFDGRGHTISGFNYSDGGNRVGLFRVVTGTVKNLNVSGSVTGSGGGANVGGIAGKNYGTIRDCTFSGTVTATGRDSYVGGIAGQNTGLILGCTNYAEINNTNGYGDTGGIAGNSKDGSIDRSRNEGNVTGRGRAGGISAAIERYRTAKTRITGLSNVGEISGANYVGGLFGYMYRFDVDGSTNSGTIYAKQYVGGIVGHSEYSYLSNCSNSGDLDTKTSGALRSWGGIAGKYDAPKLWNCCNTGNIDPYTDRDRSPDSENFGGIVGELTDQSNTTVTGCYNLGRVWSYIDGGGIVGDARRATISNCFNAGRIHVANKYYDVEGDSGGGICGFAERVVIKECGNGGDIFAEKYAGGIVGYTRICQLYDCYNAGTVYATEIAGGIAGWFVNSSLWRSISIGYINAAQNE